MTVIERMARAICEADGIDQESPHPDYGSTTVDRPTKAWQAYELHARAALAAMMEPTHGVLGAGANVAYGITFDHKGTTGHERAAAHWSAMLQAVKDGA